MAFRFSLAAVLRYREGLEHREYLALEKLQHEISLRELQIRQVAEEYARAEESRKQELARGAQSADVRSAYDYQRSLDQHRQFLLAQLQDARVRWGRQLLLYQAARRSRETLDSLRTQQQEAYNREAAKREQIALDDTFLARRRRRD